MGLPEPPPAGSPFLPADTFATCPQCERILVR